MYHLHSRREGPKPKTYNARAKNSTPRSFLILELVAGLHDGGVERVVVMDLGGHTIQIRVLDSTASLKKTRRPHCGYPCRGSGAPQPIGATPVEENGAGQVGRPLVEDRAPHSPSEPPLSRKTPGVSRVPMSGPPLEPPLSTIGRPMAHRSHPCRRKQGGPI